MRAIQAIGEKLIDTDKPFVTTGGTLMLAMGGITGRSGTEDDHPEGGLRVDAEKYTLSLARRGVRSSGVRLPPMVHSDLDHHGFTSALIGSARDSGAAAYLARAPTVGLLPTPTTSAFCTAWRSKRRPPARPSTAPAILESRSR